MWLIKIDKEKEVIISMPWEGIILALSALHLSLVSFRINSFSTATRKAPPWLHLCSSNQRPCSSPFLVSTSHSMWLHPSYCRWFSPRPFSLSWNPLVVRRLTCSRIVLNYVIVVTSSPAFVVAWERWKFLFVLAIFLSSIGAKICRLCPKCSNSPRSLWAIIEMMAIGLCFRELSYLIFTIIEELMVSYISVVSHFQDRKSVCRERVSSYV